MAGAGKTTSVQAWAAACDRQVRWISLKEVPPSRLPQTLLAHWADSIDGCPLLPQAIATLSAQEAMVQLRLMVRRLSPRSVWVMDDCDRSLQSADGQALLDCTLVIQTIQSVTEIAITGGHGIVLIDGHERRQSLQDRCHLVGFQPLFLHL